MKELKTPAHKTCMDFIMIAENAAQEAPTQRAPSEL